MTFELFVDRWHFVEDAFVVVLMFALWIANTPDELEPIKDIKVVKIVE